MTKKMNKWKISTFVLIILLIIVYATSGSTPGFTTGNAVAEDAIQYINSELLQGTGTATLGDVSSESGVYKASISIDGQPADVYLTKDGKLMFISAIPLGDVTDSSIVDTPTNPGTVDGTTFSELEGKEVCTEDGKPIVYLFSTTWCPHCEWISDTFDTFAKKAMDEGKIMAYHWEIDINDNTLTEEVETEVPEDAMAIYREANPRGSIPTFVFGCKYYRIGNGYESQNDLAAELNDFETIMGKIL
jgi:thiol-disulfide isomerase/thioredoxin